MPIHFLTGAIGGGKTYYAVSEILEKHFKFNKETDQYENTSGYTIISNIDGLTLDHLDLNEVIEKSGKGVKGFFTKDFQTKIAEKYPKIVYAIDEAQAIFDKRFYDKDTFFYFQYHRHIGQAEADIYIMTQDRSLVAREIRILAEYEIRAVKRSLSLIGELKYNILSDGVIVDRKIKKISKKVFSCYKSTDNSKTKKIRNPFRKYIVFILVLMLIAGWNAKRVFLGKKNSDKIQLQKKMDSLSGVTPPLPGHPRIADIQPPSPVPERIFPVRCSFVHVRGTIKVIDPVSKAVIPVDRLPYKHVIESAGYYTSVIAFIPEHLYRFANDAEKQSF